jgi:hypothetical protein
MGFVPSGSNETLLPGCALPDSSVCVSLGTYGRNFAGDTIGIFTLSNQKVSMMKRVTSMMIVTRFIYYIFWFTLLIHHSIHSLSLQPYCTHRYYKPIGCSLLESGLLRSYSRGAEIWPPSNEGPVELSSSFPNGKIPQYIVDRLNANISPERAAVKNNDNNEEKEPILWRKRVKDAVVDRILRRAARREEDDAAAWDKIPSRQRRGATMDRTLLLVAAGFAWTLQPLDIILLSFFTGYLSILHLLSRSTRSCDGVTPVLPALPPQGHVPIHVSNPLGSELSTYSRVYDRWLKLGIGLGLLAPLGMLIYQCGMSIVHHNSDLLQGIHIVARSLILLCAQAITESSCRGSPLPLRILVPVAYNSVRLGYLWNWALLPDGMALGRVGRLLGILNFVYWAINLFAFLIPVATMKYMRAHFFCVEAETVVTRAGMEESIGLIPY